MSLVRDAAVAHHVVLGGLVVLLVIPLVVFVDVFELRLLCRGRGPWCGDDRGRMINRAFWLRPVPLLYFPPPVLYFPQAPLWHDDLARRASDEPHYLLTFLAQPSLAGGWTDAFGAEISDVDIKGHWRAASVAAQHHGWRSAIQLRVSGLGGWILGSWLPGVPA